MGMKEIKTIAVIGTGIMGVGIAQGFAEAGLKVRMIARRQESLDQGVSLVKANLALFKEFNLLKEAPEAIEQQRIPKAAQDMAKEYFQKMREQAERDLKPQKK